MKFSIIIPSYNQPAFIEETFKNVIALKKLAKTNDIDVEILLFDSESGSDVQQIIEKYRSELDYVEIKKDKGQYDAINKGIEKSTGDFWTWLNTDDTLDAEGFLKIVRLVKFDPTLDYLYGGIEHIDENGNKIKYFPAYYFDIDLLIKHTPGIFQQGSFFRKTFTDKIGLLRNFNCCFDYEYVLRTLKNHGKVYFCDFKVANFRQHTISKTASLTPMFIREQLIISKEYGRKWFHFLSWFSQLRLIKHKLFPR